MGLFDFFKKNQMNKLDLIEWQNIINRSNHDKLLMSKKQLLDFTYNIYIPQEIRIINDCVNLINDTKTIDVYFPRWDLLIERLTELSKLEKFISFTLPLPSTQLDDVFLHKEMLNQQFLERCWKNTFDSLNKLKTEKGKQNKIKKFFDTIFSFKQYLTPSNLEYLDNLKNKYTPAPIIPMEISNECGPINIDNKIKEIGRASCRERV